MAGELRLVERTDQAGTGADIVNCRQPIDRRRHHMASRLANPTSNAVMVAFILLAGIGPATGRAARGQGLNDSGGAKSQSPWPESPAHKRLLADAEKSVAAAASRVGSDRLRPAFHFLPAGRFMNDPNGCVQFGGVYHMFFQHLPFWGQPNAASGPGWGHATSRDMVHWQHLPIALMPIPGTYDAEAVASGCCVIADGLPTIVYTSVPPQAQSLARSFDGMRTWRRFGGNPVIPKPPAIAGLEDGFRDPFVWREGSKWRLIAGSGIRGQGGTVLMYESADLVSWNYLGPLATGMGPDCFQWECPNFFRLGEQWVLVVSPLLHSISSLRGPVQYAVGHYDGRHFEHGPWRPLDLGGPTVFYAPNSLEDNRGRRIQWGWLMGGGSPNSPWDGLLTLPRRLEVGPDQRLRVWPVKEIETLRGPSLVDVAGRDLKAGESFDACHGEQLDVVLELDKRRSERIDVELFRSPSGDHATRISFDPSTGELRSGDKAGVVPPSEGDTRTLRIVVDRSVIEVYADHREVMSLRAYPPPGADGLRLTAAKGLVQLVRVQAWRMGSIW
jgi:beta-fructofuranosidase